jgi:hypothetical protein
MFQRRKLTVALLATFLSFNIAFQAACGASTLSKLHDSLNQAAKSLNAAAKTNHQFYEGGVYGAVGSPNAITTRQKAATVIHDANEKLILALNLAQNLTAATFEQGKLAVLQALADAAAGLSTGNTKIDLVLQSVATIINQAVVLIQAFKSAQLKYVLPEIRTWKLAEVSV